MEPTPVRMHIYDLSRGFAGRLSPVLLGNKIDGLWHSTVVVGETELSYGPPLRRYPAGRGPLGQPDRVIDMGSTLLPPPLIDELLAGMTCPGAGSFAEAAYDILTNNCNHFTHELAGVLTGGGLPDDILHQGQLWLQSPLLGDMVASAAATAALAATPEAARDRHQGAEAGAGVRAGTNQASATSAASAAAEASNAASGAGAAAAVHEAAAARQAVLRDLLRGALMQGEGGSASFDAMRSILSLWEEVVGSFAAAATGSGTAAGPFGAGAPVSSAAGPSTVAGAAVGTGGGRRDGGGAAAAEGLGACRRRRDAGAWQGGCGGLPAASAAAGADGCCPFRGCGAGGIPFGLGSGLRGCHWRPRSGPSSPGCGFGGGYGRWPFGPADATGSGAWTGTGGCPWHRGCTAQLPATQPAFGAFGNAAAPTFPSGDFGLGLGLGLGLSLGTGLSQQQQSSAGAGACVGGLDLSALATAMETMAAGLAAAAAGKAAAEEAEPGRATEAAPQEAEDVPAMVSSLLNALLLGNGDDDVIPHLGGGGGGFFGMFGGFPPAAATFRAFRTGGGAARAAAAAANAAAPASSAPATATAPAAATQSSRAAVSNTAAAGGDAAGLPAPSMAPAAQQPQKESQDQQQQVPQPARRVSGGSGGSGSGWMEVEVEVEDDAAAVSGQPAVQQQ